MRLGANKYRNRVVTRDMDSFRIFVKDRCYKALRLPKWVLDRI